MWHVDEGTLHAWLDDRERGPAAAAIDDETRARVHAHLAACDECAARLESAGRHRDGTRDILAAASPVIESPPFAAIVPLTPERRTQPATRRAWVPLAWAASLVLAIGAGWMGSQLWRGAPPVRETANLEAARQPTGTNEAAANQAAVGDVAAATDALEASTSEQKRSEPLVAAAPPAAAAIAAPAVIAPAERPVVVADAQLAQQSRPDSNAVAKAAGVTELARDRAEFAAFVGGEVAGYPGDADVAWREITPADAQRMLAGPPYLLADAEVTGMAAATTDRRTIVRVRQRTAQGEVELVQWRETATADAAPAAVAAPLPPPARALRSAEARAELAPPIRRTEDGGRYLSVPGTSHPVILKVRAEVDPLPLLTRLRRGD